MENKLKKEIQKIKSRIEELKQVANSDIGASFKEAVQTQDMIKMLEIRLHDLIEEDIGRGKDSQTSFVLKSQKGQSIRVIITDGNPDPANNIFSHESPIGKEVTESKPGDKIKLRGEIYTISR